MKGVLWAGLYPLKIHVSKFSPPAAAAAAAAAAAPAKSLQSCPTLCDPRDGSPPGSPVPGILQARTLEWVAISFPVVPNLTVFGDRVFKRIIKWNEFVRVGSDLVWWVSYKNRLGHGHPEKDTRRRNWASQGGWPQKELTLLTTWPWTCSLQNCEKINVCCLRQPVCGTLLWQQQTNMEGS